MSTRNVGRQLRVVIVMNDEEMRTWLVGVVTDLGHQLAGVYAGIKEGCEGCRSLLHVPDLLVTDRTAPLAIKQMQQVFVYRQRVVPVILIGRTVESVLAKDDVRYIFGRYVFPTSAGQVQAAILNAAHQFERVSGLEQLVTEASARRAKARDIDIAIDILRERFGYSGREARRYLARLATSRGRVLVAHARAIIEANKLYYPQKRKSKK